jgi:uncharacterized protein YqfA (UPF0365 family)
MKIKRITRSTVKSEKLIAVSANISGFERRSVLEKCGDDIVKVIGTSWHYTQNLSNTQAVH